MSDPTRRGSNAPTEDIPSGDRDPFDRMAEEFADRCRRGESPSISEYEARHPDDVEKVRKLLGAVAMMEQLRRGAPQARFLPERFGEYRVLRELGRGGMGVVYEAVQESLWRQVAVKAMHHIHLDPKRLQRFQREAQAVARLHHTNIVPIFGFGEHDGLPYYVMQLIPGQGLDVLLESWRRDGAPRGIEHWRFVARVGLQAAEALHYAHEQGVLHRDVKPANLLIDEHRAVWITDFGLAKLAGRDELTASGDLIGTLRYLAPEALHGETDRRSDVYSLGLTLYELLTLNAPFGELSPSELLRRVSEGEPTVPRELEPAIPSDLETIVLKSIARDPDHRYASAGELAADLKCFLDDRPIRARRVTLVERAWRWSRRNRAIAALSATAAGSLLLAAVVGWIGYVSTVRALGRSQANVALSLDVFEKLFEKLAPDNGLPPPPIGQLGRGSTGGPPDRDGKPPGPGRGMLGNFFRMGSGPPPDGGPPDGRGGAPHGPGSGPFGPRGRGIADDDPVLLQTVLSFYDRFAQQNATNPRLQGEAAWAYRKVAALYRRLGREAEAEQADARAIAMFEEILSSLPRDREARFKLVQTLIMADPWSVDRAKLDRVEARLLRAEGLIEGLATELPDDLDYLQGRIHVQARLGGALQRLGRGDEAEARYRKAIEMAGEALARSPDNVWPLLDRTAIGEILAVLQVERGHVDQARNQVELIEADLRFFETEHEGMNRPLEDRVRSLAGIFESLGEDDRADEMTRWAEQIGTRADRGGPHRLDPTGAGGRDRDRPGDRP